MKLKISSNHILIKLLVETNIAPKFTKLELNKSGKMWIYKHYALTKSFIENDELCIIMKQEGILKTGFD